MLSNLDKVIFLKGVPLFADLPSDALAGAAAALDVIRVAAHERLFSVGDPARTMYIVMSGQIKIHIDDEVFQSIGPHTIFGEMAVLDEKPRTASATAEVEATLLCMRQEALYDLMSDHMEVAHGIIQMLSARLRDRGAEIAELVRQLGPPQTPPGGAVPVATAASETSEKGPA